VKTFWIVVSGLCGVTAVVFVVWRDDYEKAFIAATLGAVAWFLSYRTHLKRAQLTTDETDEDEEEDQL
jgi:hypothetical protein